MESFGLSVHYRRISALKLLRPTRVVSESPGMVKNSQKNIAVFTAKVLSLDQSWFEDGVALVVLVVYPPWEVGPLTDLV